MHDLILTLVQTTLYWENVEANLDHFDRLLEKPGPTDLFILPEMFNTGFITQPEDVAETMNGETLQWMKKRSKEHGVAMCGSLIIREEGQYYNRLVFITPEGELHHYDKRHLFSMAGEHLLFSKGRKRLVVPYKGWNIMPLVCYDLRFPAWSKNRWKKSNYEYDLLVYIANWPEVRSHTWKSLLPARALENLAYVAAVNRIGEDGNGIPHSGDSMVIDPKGETILPFRPGLEMVQSIQISKKELVSLRENFNVGPDWDRLKIDD